MQKAIEALDERPPAERPQLESERDWRLANATTHAKTAANLLFDALAEQCWTMTRPKASLFSDQLAPMCEEVKQTIACSELESDLVETLDAAAAKWVKKTAREGAVKDSRQWSDLRAKFADLLRQETELWGKVTDDRLLHAHGTYSAGGREFGEWSLVGATERIQSDYTLLATHAAVALGAPAGADLVRYFLHNVFSNLIEGNSQYLSYASLERGGMIRSLLEATVMCCTRFERIAVENEHSDRISRQPANSTPPTVDRNTPGTQPTNAPTLADVEAALNGGDRKLAVKLRCRIDSCNITELWTGAFKDRGGSESTMQTAFNRWQASRQDTPYWADPLMRAHLLRAVTSPDFLPTRLH